MSGTHLFSVVKGEDFAVALTWLGADGTPVDLTNYSAELFIGPVTVESGEDTGLARGGTAGTITINVPPDALAGLSATQDYRLMLTNADGTRCLLFGPFQVSGVAA